MKMMKFKKKIRLKFKFKKENKVINNLLIKEW